MRKKKVINADLITLFGISDYSNHITVGRKYYSYFPDGSREINYIGGNGRHLKLTVTYVRSGIFFFTLDDKPDKEFNCHIDSYRGIHLIVETLDPELELHWQSDLNMYRFNDMFTKILNFNNEDVEVPDDYYDVLL